MPKPAKPSLLSTEVTHVALQRAIDALAALLQAQQKKRRTEPPPASEVEQQITATDATKPRRKRGFRGTPPPAQFSLAELPDDSLLTEYEVAAAARLSTNTLAIWRKRDDHPLRWVKIGGGRVRYRAGDVRQFIAAGERPRPGRPRKKNATPAPKQDAAPAPRRRAARPRTVDGVAAPQEPSP